MKKLKTIILTLIAVLTLTACGNHQIVDITYTYNRAVISMPDGSVVEGQVHSWCDYEDGDQIQVVLDGKTYLTHATNVVLIAE